MQGENLKLMAKNVYYTSVSNYCCLSHALVSNSVSYHDNYRMTLQCVTV